MSAQVPTLAEADTEPQHTDWTDNRPLHLTFPPVSDSPAPARPQLSPALHPGWSHATLCEAQIMC